MYASMYACIYVCKYVCTSMYVCMYEYVCLFVCMYVCMYVSMYVCMQIRVVNETHIALFTLFINKQKTCGLQKNYVKERNLRNYCSHLINILCDFTETKTRKRTDTSPVPFR